MCYLVLVLNERPQFGLGLASRLLLALSGVGEAGVGRRPLHGLAVVLKLHVSRGLEPGLIRFHHLFRVLRGVNSSCSNQEQLLSLIHSYLFHLFKF